jgi:3,4-dihydroxy 2-butanone 4-phosphate synthase/GTP cyclohydrolase II
MFNPLSINAINDFKGIRGGIEYTCKYYTFNGFPPEMAADPPHAMVFGEREWDDGPLVRVQSYCRNGHVLGSYSCDCGPQLDCMIGMALERLKQRGCSIVILIPGHEGRGAGLNAKMRGYQMVADGTATDTYAAYEAMGLPPDGRDYDVAGAMINTLGYKQCVPVTGNPETKDKLNALQTKYEFKILGFIPMQRFERPENADYLRAKETLRRHVFAPG